MRRRLPAISPAQWIDGGRRRLSQHISYVALVLAVALLRAPAVMRELGRRAGSARRRTYELRTLRVRRWFRQNLGDTGLGFVLYHLARAGDSNPTHVISESVLEGFFIRRLTEARQLRPTTVWRPLRIEQARTAVRTILADDPSARVFVRSASHLRFWSEFQPLHGERRVTVY
jgi:hypothetical protein